MRVLMLSWEYPPLVVGGLGRHVEALARELVASGHEVDVVTRGDKNEVVDETVDGVRVRRAALDPLAIDFAVETLLAWSQAAEHSMIRAALPLLARRRPDVVHAHDWLAAQSAITVAEAARAPLVATVHASEAGRNQGWLSRPLNLAIHSIERWLVGAADAVITCSVAMRDETARLFETDPARIDVIANGVEVERWRPSESGDRDRCSLVYVGRLAHEKGVPDLVEAVAALRGRHPALTLTIAGTGPAEGELRAIAARAGVDADWRGFVTDDEIAALFARAGAVIVPSRYEPFGLVALEAAAAGAPVIVSRAGGLAELADAGAAVASYPPGDVAALAERIESVLTDAAATRQAVALAGRVLSRDYSWTRVAERTAEVYRRILT